MLPSGALLLGVPYEFLDRNQMLAKPFTGISGWGRPLIPTFFGS